MYTILVLLDQVLLIASLFGLSHDDRFGWTVPIVGDVEETSDIVKELFLTLVDFQIFPDHHHAIVTMTSCWAVRQLGNVSLDRPNVFELTTLDDSLVSRSGTEHALTFFLHNALRLGGFQTSVGRFSVFS